MNLAAQSFKWDHNKKRLSILDQTLIPVEESWVEVKDSFHMVEIIKNLQVRGAPLIGVAAALTLAQDSCAGAKRADILERAELLKKARPTAVNLMWAVEKMRQACQGEGWERACVEQAEKIALEDQALCDKIGENGSEVIPQGAQILTHCNTGGLATAGSGTAFSVMLKAHLQNKNIHVYVDETRPLLQGGRLTTWELAKNRIPYTLICDNMAAFLMAQKKVDLVIVGADRIAKNGDFANKVGTYNLAVLCHYHKIPFYVAAPWTTLDFELSSGQEIPVEQRTSMEVTGYKDIQWAPQKSPVYNPAFDVTPAQLVTAFIFDKKVVYQKDLQDTPLQEGELCGLS